MVALGETPNYEQPKVEKIENANPNGGNIAEFNNNPKLAQEEADRIVEGLPDTLKELSPAQQEQFVGLVENDFNLANLDFAPKNAESVPNIIPEYWKQQVDVYREVRTNFEKLPPDKQEALKKAEKNAISKMTEASKEALSGGVMPDNKPESTPDIERGSMPDSEPGSSGDEL